MSIEELKQLFANPLDYVSGNVLDADKCRQLAEDLMKRFWIKKGDRHYWIKDIEFYIYCDSHRDIITYPRNCEAGSWFLHDSGVDITFQSKTDYAKHPHSKRWKPRLTKNSVFGGILIREIERVEKLELPDGAVESFKGPWLSRNELFYSIDAFQTDPLFPHLEPSAYEKPGEVKVLEKREGFPDNAAKKISTIKYNYSIVDIPDEELIAAYDEYRLKPYHFSI